MSNHEGSNGGKQDEETIDIYKAYLEDLGRLGSRHEGLRQFYVSIISALFVFIALADKDGVLVKLRNEVQVMVGMVGILISVLWLLHMHSYAELYTAKKTVLANAENNLPLKPFSTEQTSLVHRIRVTTIDQLIAAAFIIFFIVLLVIKTDGTP